MTWFGCHWSFQVEAIEDLALKINLTIVGYIMVDPHKELLDERAMKDSESSTSRKIIWQASYTLELIVVQRGLPLCIKLSMKPLFVVLRSWDGSPRNSPSFPQMVTFHTLDRLLFLLRRLPRP
ncbi:hypothetical protein CMV_024555 [Castanea mollissima]|uniref:Uncharacterized protein n=1 Tax=Castanea mollissima TaxID=60419 RepID=A0A8J4QE34_9ROSI|nr:hypothetical protein CMV_024555 [Castanea mollissima]